MADRRRHVGPPPAPTNLKEELSNTTNVEFAFDEADRKKFDALAEPFLQQNITNLPGILERTINNAHNDNARELVDKADTLKNTSIGLQHVLEQINHCLESSADTRKKEEQIYEQIRAIDTNREDDSYIITHRKQAIAKIDEIIAAYQTDTKKWKDVLGTKDFPRSKLPLIYEVVSNMSNQVKNHIIPPELIGLKLGEDRLSHFKDLLKSFANAFSNDLDMKLQVPAKLVGDALQNKLPPCTILPQKPDSTDPPKPFSIDVSDHMVLRTLYPFWNLIQWVKENYPENMVPVEKKYITTAAQYNLMKISEHTMKLVQEVGKPVEKTLPKGVIEDPFNLVKSELSSESFINLSDLIENQFQEIFRIINIEATVMQEFWNIEPTSEFIEGKIVDQIIYTTEKLTLVSPIFALRVAGICMSESKKCKVDISSITSKAQEKWNDYLVLQETNYQNNTKLSRKASILPIFKIFPVFMKTLISVSHETDMAIIEQTFVTLTTNLMNWLNKDIAPKFTKNKKTLMNILNTSHCLEKLTKIKAIVGNEVMTEALSKMEHLKDSQMKLFMNWLVGKTWKKTVEFFDQISDWKSMEGITSEMVTFQPTHTDVKYQECMSNLEKKLSQDIITCKDLMAKKIKKEKLRSSLFKSLIPLIAEKFQEWNDLAIECYGVEISITPEKIKEALSAK